MSSEPLSNNSDDCTGAKERNGARNQALIRELNEQVCAYATSPPQDVVVVICECSEVGCWSLVTLPSKKYERIRRSATQFIVKPGHASSTGERVVQQATEYTVVEKLGEGAAIATRLDSRRGRPAGTADRPLDGGIPGRPPRLSRP